MVGLIVPGTIKFCPYVNYYIDILNQAQIPFEIISWDKRGLNENVTYAYRYKTRDGQLLKKTIGYIGFRNYVLHICKMRKYDKLIVFTLAPALLIKDYLVKNYAGKFILDIRDDTVLRRYAGKKIKALVDSAIGVVTSSHEFDVWLGSDTIMCHNVDANIVKDVVEKGKYPCPVKKRDDAFRRIMFAGSLNEWNINLKILQSMKNNPDVIFIYHTPDVAVKKNLTSYCEAESVENVLFFGEYKKSEIYDMYRNEADFANCIRCESEVNRNALPNKLYDAMLSGVPILVLAHNKAICDYVKKYHLGLIFNDEQDFIDNFIQQSKVFDYDLFATGRMQFLQKILDECTLFASSVIFWCNK